MENATPYDVLEEKWQPVLETNALPAIGDHYKSKVTSVLLENTETALREQGVNERLRANLFRDQGALAMQTGQIRANTATLQGLQSMARQSYLMASA